jgi:hypothetical protein
MLVNRAGPFIHIRKEMIKMPWYTNPIVTCKVLGRIANRYEYTTLQDLKYVLDNAVDLIQKKLERYHETSQKR